MGRREDDVGCRSEGVEKGSTAGVRYFAAPLGVLGVKVSPCDVLRTEGPKES